MSPLILPQPDDFYNPYDSSSADALFVTPPLNPGSGLLAPLNAEEAAEEALPALAPRLPLLSEIALERARQQGLWGPQNYTPVEWVAIALEELGEASKEAVDAHFNPAKRADGALARYRAEMIQTAAVLLGALESLDRGLWETEAANGTA